MKEQEPVLLDASSVTAQDMFASVLRRRIQDGALENAIASKVDTLINSVADDVFKSYGEIAKAIKEKLTAAIIPQISDMGDLPVYHDFVMNRIKLAAQNFYDQRLTAVVDAELKEVFSELPEQITLSWIVEKLTKEASQDDEDGEQITLIIDNRKYSWAKKGDYIFVYLDKCHDKTKNNCKYYLHLTKDTKTGNYDLLGLKVGGSKPGPT